LVVVDGQPTPDGLSAVNNADVESVEVLRMPSAIYGSRGAGRLYPSLQRKEKKTTFNLK
jgi:hypothetical protein